MDSESPYIIHNYHYNIFYKKIQYHYICAYLNPLRDPILMRGDDGLHLPAVLRLPRQHGFELRVMRQRRLALQTLAIFLTH